MRIKVGRCAEHRRYYFGYLLGYLRISSHILAYPRISSHILAYPQMLIFNYLILLGNTKTKKENGFNVFLHIFIVDIYNHLVFHAHPMRL